jgi:hypothetical protein
VNSAQDAPVAPSYLAAAEQAGLLETLHGHAYVADTYQEPLLDEQQVLVEYCAPELLLDPSGMDELTALLLSANPDAAAVVVRTPGTVVLDARWERQLTYVRHQGGPQGSDSTPADVAVGLAVAERDDRVIAGWLARAFTDGVADQEVVADAETVDAITEHYLHVPDRVSYVATRDGRPVGHATLLCAAHDNVTARDHIELLDVLADLAEPADRRAVTAALTRAAIAHAERAGSPLIGHVVHPARGVAPGRGEAITGALVEQGWCVDHVYWRLDQGDVKDGA